MYQLSLEPEEAEDLFKSLLFYNILSDFVFNYHLILIGAFFVFNIVLQVLSGTDGKNLDVLLLQPLHTQ
jgi:hypothetical protein